MANLTEVYLEDTLKTTIEQKMLKQPFRNGAGCSPRHFIAPYRVDTCHPTRMSITPFYLHFVVLLIAVVWQFICAIWSVSAWKQSDVHVCRCHVTSISCRRCCLLECLQRNEKLHGEKCFYTFDDIIKPHFCYYDIIILFSDWLAHSQSHHLVGIFFILHDF